MDFDVRIPMRDGTELSADIYRPDAEGRFPVILVRTPYNNNTDAEADFGRFYAARGYGVITQDVRGRWDSGGDFHAFVNEARDGFDTHEWAGTQPWSNGKVGTYGGSYVGLTQLLPAFMANPHLQAMVPMVTTSDLYNNWMYSDGAFQLGFSLSWGGILIDGRTNQNYTPYDWRRLFGLPADEAIGAAGRRVPHYDEWVSHPTLDDYWKSIIDGDHAQVPAPAMFIAGWYDIFLRGSIQDYTKLVDAAVSKGEPSRHKLIIGPWVHGFNQRQVGDVDFGPAAVLDLQTWQLRWFDHRLKGIDNGIDEEPPVKIFVMGRNQWRDENEWPPARARYTKYFFHGDGAANSLNGNGTLDTVQPGGEPQEALVYDPGHPVPTLGGGNCCRSWIVPMGPFDHRAVERRDDVLVFTGEVLQQEVEVTGPISVVLYASSTARDTDFVARLVDVHPDGFAQNIQDGIVRARHRESLESSSLIEPGRIYQYEIDLWSTSNVFLKGHRIRVEITSSNFPRFDRNPNTGRRFEGEQNLITATQTIYHDEQHPSHIVLPIISNDDGSK
jgi:putative CocE/NonD family hydrolase